MLSPQQILSGLYDISAEWKVLAILWYVYFGGFALVIAAGFTLTVFKRWRPSMRVVGIVLTIPLLGISALAWLTGNLFLGTTFALSGAVLAVVANKLSMAPVQVAPLWVTLPGVLILFFSWFYPYLLEVESLVPYLPVGLNSCPTLSTVIGLSLITGFSDSRAWSIALGATGILYGLYGVAYLPLIIDWVSLVGAVLIVMIAFMQQQRQITTESA